MTFGNSKGQALMETLLLFVLITMAAQLAVSQFRDKDFFQKVFGDPWGALLNEIHYGVRISDANKARQLHPANTVRQVTQKEK